MPYRKTKPWGLAKPPVGAALDGNDPINIGLVGFWPFNEAAGNIVGDVVRGRNGALVNGPTWAASAHGRQFGVVPVIDGSNDYIDVGSLFDFAASKEFSVCVWVLASASDQADGAGLICRGNGGGGEQYNIDVRSNANGGHFRFYIRDSGASVTGNINTATGSALNNTQWRLVVGTFSGNNTSQKIYLDGVLAASASPASSLQAVTHITSIGARQSGSGAYDLALNGKIAAPRIYNRALTSTEVLRLFNEPYAGLASPRKRLASAAGAGGVTGTVAKTNANDTSAASGTTTILGTLAKTNANDTLSASGTTTVTGTLAKTNANDGVVASGTTTVTGALAKTNANDTVVASGAAGNITGTLAYTNNNDTVVASGVATQPAGVIGPPGGGGARHWSNYGVPKKKKRIDEVLAAEVKVVEAIQVAEEKGIDRSALDALLAKLKKLELQLRKLAQESEAARQYIARKRMEDEELEIVMSLLH